MTAGDETILVSYATHFVRVMYTTESTREELIDKPVIVSHFSLNEGRVEDTAHYNLILTITQRR